MDDTSTWNSHPTLPEPTPSDDPDAILARKIYEEEAELVKRIAIDEQIARELQAKEEAYQHPPKSQSNPRASEASATQSEQGGGFWQWFGEVRQKGAELMDDVARNLKEFKTTVEQKGSSFVSAVKTESKLLVDEAKLSIEEILDSDVIKTAKKELNEFGDKVSSKTKEIVEHAKNLLFDDGKVFGVHLSVAAQGRLTPLIVELCVQRIEDEVLNRSGRYANSVFDVELLFSVDAEHGVEIRKLREAIQDGTAFDLDSHDIYTVCGLLLAFCKELPHSILPFNGNLIGDENNEMNRVALIKGEIENMDGTRYFTTRLLVNLFHKLQMYTSQQSTGSLDVIRLSNLFGPTFIRDYVDNFLSQNLMKCLILHAPTIFPANLPTRFKDMVAKQQAAAAAATQAEPFEPDQDMLILSSETLDSDLA